MSGRPTKYDPAFCETAIDLMGLGLSIMAVAGEIGVSRRTIYEWIDAWPEFAAAVDIGRAKRVLSLERSLLDAMSGPTVTSRIFALKNACPDEWRDRIEHGGNVSITIAGADVGFL